ncbi:hypothetical protein BDV33DRAFT_186140 [Aspergillus novoparasiticus]|uniref:Uncharacterized protein n=1 Tax=Aspergillus novoparasiticus TaxID=986946 RepID=A0A5N6E8Q6_9EURO|nr:hypothetical protein BDV33DRAFT_186140 [Aspergillus novoparasiticus]
MLPLIVAFQQDSLPGHLAYIKWNMHNVPEAGLGDIIFPMSIQKATHEEGWYFAQDFEFIGASDVGYTGLQPRPDIGNETRLHAVFSSFVNGTTSKDPNCYDGADYGPGVSCAVDVSGKYSNMYHLRVQNTRDTTWNGTLIDTVTGIETHIGSYTLPTGSLGIKGSQLGFVEWWPFNNGLPVTCGSLNQTSVAFGIPTTSTEGAGPGSLEDPYEVYECAGKQNFKFKRVSDNVEVGVGFKTTTTLSESIFTIPWTVSNVTPAGLSDVAFPITFMESDPGGRYIFSQSFSFGNLSYGGILELKPLSAKVGSYLHARFRSFIPGTTTSDKKCRLDSDATSAHCSVLFRGNHSHTYHLRVYNTGGTGWAGSVTDTVTGRSHHIGSYELPSGTGGIAGFQIGGVKFDTENSRPLETCSSLANVSAVFGKPIVLSTVVGLSDLGDAQVSRDCAQYGSKKYDNGVMVHIHLANKGAEEHVNPVESLLAVPSAISRLRN